MRGSPEFLQGSPWYLGGRNQVLAASIILLGLAVVVVLILTHPYTLRGSVIEPPQPAPEISLTGADGESFTLAQQRGKLIVLFFGYTSCPDVCPTTLSQMRQVMADLGKKADAVRIVFITVDPKRDTPSVLQRYMSVFGQGFIGLSGSQEQLEGVWKSYGVYRATRPIGDNPNAYTVDHTARLYLIDMDGRLRLTYPFGTLSDDILQDLLFLLKGG